MSRTPAQFRFLVLVVGGWALGRGAILLLPAEEQLAVETRPRLIAGRHMPRAGGGIETAAHQPLSYDPSPLDTSVTWDRASPPQAHFVLAPIPTSAAAAYAPLPLPVPSITQLQAAPIPTPLIRSSRWAADVWTLIREGKGRGDLSVPGLGGSQLGGRIRYRLRTGLDTSLRIYAPLATLKSGDIAIGFDWQPVSRFPIHLLVERRQALSGSGRSAFSGLAYAGSSTDIAGGRLDVYAQAGLIGARARDGFADGSAALTWPVDEVGSRVRIGGGIWAAAQPGVARMDAGPRISIQPMAERPLTLSLDWRQRIAGDAAPSSGPAVTLSTAF